MMLPPVSDARRASPPAQCNAGPDPAKETPACTQDAPHRPRPIRSGTDTAFGCRRHFLDNRFVYLVIAARTHGLSIGVNFTPDLLCNFDCVYCEVARPARPPAQKLDVAVMAVELERTLALVRTGRIREQAAFRDVSDELLKLRHVAISGDGEPTLSPHFGEAVQEIVHVRARVRQDFFKMTLLTNGGALHLPAVHDSLRFFTESDEVWIKLDAGSQRYMDRVNAAIVPLSQVLENILKVGRERPVVIQTSFCVLDGQGPTPIEIDEYLMRLTELKNGGARISEVQLYSACRPDAPAECSILPLKNLSAIRQRVKVQTGLHTEVF